MQSKLTFDTIQFLIEPCIICHHCSTVFLAGRCFLSYLPPPTNSLVFAHCLIIKEHFCYLKVHEERGKGKKNLYFMSRTQPKPL